MEQFCPWEPATFLISSANVPHLLYYSHIPAMIIALLIGIIVFYRSGKSQMGASLLAMTGLFFLWSFADLILWATNDPSIVMFFWSLQILIEPLIYIISFFFTYLFIFKEPPPFAKKLLLFLLYIPIVLLLSSKYNISGVNLIDCTAIENFIAQYYTYIVELVSALAIFGVLILTLKHITDPDRKKEARIFGLGVLLFLVAFSWGNIIGSFTDNWALAQAGLIGMPIFFGFFAYMVVRFKTFNMKVFGTQLLVLAILILVGSLFFVSDIDIIHIIIGITFLLLLFFGYLLISSVRVEIEQKEKLQILTRELEAANEKLKSLDKLKTEFLSLASHQLRSPLTAIKGYTSMLMTGDFGAVSDKQKEAIGRVFESSDHLTKIVEDLLNVTKIEMGGMQYVMVPFDFEKQARDLTTDLSITAQKKGLALTFETDGKAPYTVNGDMEKIRQVILNLIDNSVKYTKEGSIKVKLVKDEAVKKIRLAITDTGMGMTPEIKATLFQKFNRGEGGKMNAGGSGLGLYLAKQIVEAHKGLVGVESPGMGLGSTFFIELDLKE